MAGLNDMDCFEFRPHPIILISPQILSSWPEALIFKIETCAGNAKSQHILIHLSAPNKCEVHHIFQKTKNALPAQTQCIPVHQSAILSSVQLCGTQSSPKWFNAVPFKLVFISKEVFTPRPWSQKKFILSVLVHFIFCSIAYRVFVSVGQHYLQLQLSPQLGVTPWSTPWSHKPGFITIFSIGNKESCSTDKAFFISSNIPLVTLHFFFFFLLVIWTPFFLMFFLIVDQREDQRSIKTLKALSLNFKDIKMSLKCWLLQ